MDCSSPVFGATASHADPQVSSIIHTTETDIAYEQFGHGSEHAPAIIVNGGPGFSHTYMYLTDIFTRKFARNRTVTFYDQRGIGDSKLRVRSAPQGMPAQIADLEALRTKLGYDKIDLIGHSWGGQIAMAYAVAFPQHVRRLVLIDSTAPKFSQTLFLFDQVFPDELADDEQLAKAANSEPETNLHPDLPSTVSRLIIGRSHAGIMLRRYLARDFYSPERFQDLTRNISNEQISQMMNNEVSSAVVAAVESLDLIDGIRRLSIPTLIMWGRFDINVAVLTGWEISKAIPDAKMVVYDKSGHFPFYEEETLFLRDLNEFLREDSRPSSH